MKNLSWYLFAFLAGLQVFDIISTYIVLDRGGIEKNQAVKWLMSATGILPALLVMKALLLSGIAIAVIYYPSVYLTFVLIVACGWYVHWCIHNYRQL